VKPIFLCFLILCAPAIWADKQYPELTQLYTKITGFGISDGEKETIKSAGGAPTYGEILPKSVSILLADLKLTEEDVFYDLGSGVGKVAVQVYLESPVKKSVGVELSPTRHNHAMKVHGKLKDAGKLKANRDLVFCQENILHADISDATVLFLCSTCYSDELMADLASKMQQLKPGTRILTLKPFKSTTSLKLLKTYQLPMTWTEASAVHLYQVV
jgi:precorrin-6B methylase 2